MEIELESIELCIMKISLIEYNILITFIFIQSEQSQQPVESEITLIMFFNTIVKITNQQHDSAPLTSETLTSHFFQFSKKLGSYD